MTHTPWSQAVYTHICKQLTLYEDATCVFLVGITSLLSDEVLQALRQTGWTPKPLPSEPMALRHLYEQLCRVPWPSSPQRIVFLLEEAEGERLILPYDIEQDNPVVRVKATTFFPLLDASILRLVPPGKYERLLEHVQDLGIEVTLSPDETLALVLEACYGLRLPDHLSLLVYIRFLADLVRNNVHLPKLLAQEIESRVRQRMQVEPPLSPVEAKQFLASVWETYRRMVAPRPGEASSVAERGYSPLLLEAASLLSRSPELQAAFTQLRLAGALPQGEFRSRDITRRILEKHANVGTIPRAVRRILQSMVDWGVIKKAGNLYTAYRVCSISDKEALEWFIEAVVRAAGRDAWDLRDLPHAPEVFPFEIPQHVAYIAQQSEHLSVQYEGADRQIVVVKR